MSTKTISKIETRMVIGFDDETKAEINALKDKLDKIAHAMSAKNENHGDHLLAVMQAEAANDTPQPELKELGQWVFEGQDEKWQSAAVNSDGRAFRHNLPSSHVYFHKGVWRSNCFDQHEIELIDGAFDTSDFLPMQIDRKTINDVDYLSCAANDAPQPELKELGQWVFEGQDEKWVSAAKDADDAVWLFQVPVKDLARNENVAYLLWYTQDGSKATYLCDLRSNEDWKNSAIDRETVNDVDYLSDDDLNDSVPHIDDVLAQPNWLSDSVPQITQDDLQLIFIKNLSNVLIQRMQTMDRFSEDDYAIGGDKLMAWDIVIDRFGKVGVLTGLNKEKSNFTFCFFCQDSWLFQNTVTVSFTAANVSSREVCTITEAELPAFREALEACYV